jgi:hypothetical protein
MRTARQIRLRVPKFLPPHNNTIPPHTTSPTRKESMKVSHDPHHIHHRQRGKKARNPRTIPTTHDIANEPTRQESPKVSHDSLLTQNQRQQTNKPTIVARSPPHTISSMRQESPKPSHDPHHARHHREQTNNYRTITATHNIGDEATRQGSPKVSHDSHVHHRQRTRGPQARPKVSHDFPEWKVPA